MKMTERSAKVKDWRIRRKHDRAMRTVARSLMQNRGYIIATPKELNRQFPHLFPEKMVGNEDRNFIWAVGFDDFSKGDKMAFVPIR